MRTHTIDQIVIILLFCVGLSIGASVTGVSVAGDTVRITTSAATLDLVPATDNMVECCYYTTARRGPRTDMISPTYRPAAHFSSVQTTTDPIVVAGPNYRVQINRANFTVAFLDKNGTELFKTRAGTDGFWEGGSYKTVQADVTKGPYYGVSNDGRQLSRSFGSLDGIAEVSAGDQGHGGAPFIWTTKGLGFIADNGGGSMSINDGASACYLQSVKESTEGTRLFFLIAGAPREIMYNYHTVTGFPPMPPLWALGFLHSQWGWDQNTAKARARTYRQKDIPVDAFILDFEWMDWGNPDGEFKWNPSSFPGGMTGALRDTMNSMGIKLMGIRKPRVHTATPAGAYCEQQKWYVWKENDYFSNKEVGNLNFDIPACRQWYWQKFVDPAYNSYERGIVACWNDEGGYGNFQNFHWQQGQYEGQVAMNNLRVFSLNRSYFAGAQRFAYGLWSGDIGTGFGSQTSQSLYMLSSICIGAQWWSMDVGGFDGHPTNENYFRWMQMGAFVPIFRVHSNHDDRSPWTYGAEAERICTEFIRLRYQLLPYLYAAFRSSTTQGLPPVRPLVMDYPGEATTANELRCWMFGPDMLVAPVTTVGATSATFYLPTGDWMSYWNDSLVAGGKEVTLNSGRDRIPLLVKRGSVVPLRPWGRFSTDTLALKEIAFHVYCGAAGSGAYYEDDYATREYESGAYCSIPIAHTLSTDGDVVTLGPRQGSFAPRQRSGQFVFHGRSAKPLEVLRNRVQVPFADSAAFAQTSSPAWTWWPGKRQVVVKVNDPLAPGELVVSQVPVLAQGAMRRVMGTDVRLRSCDKRPVLAIRCAPSTQATVRILDASGRTAFSWTGSVHAGELLLPMSRLGSGTYVWSARIGNRALEGRFALP